uniref:Vps16 N-terminal domain-containing protein n=1 Tax=Panagrolaimus sp. PS1159 TaxID=55785 RepID=A0AC35FP13_9BILA
MPTAFSNDWYLLGPTPLRKISLYKNINLPFQDGCRFSSCPYGGPIAIAQSQDRTNWNISICNAKGTIFCNFSVTELHKLFWTKCQKLVVVALNGEIRLYSVFGDELCVFDMNKKIRDIGFLHVVTFNKQDNSLETGLAMMDNSQRLFIVNNIVHRLIWTLSPLAKQSHEPSCLTVVHTAGKTSVIVCYEEQFFIGAQESSFESVVEEWMFNEGGSYIAAQSSWDQSKIVFVHTSKCAQVTTSDLQYLLHTIVISSSPQSLTPQWCGNDVLAFRVSLNELIFYSMAGDEKTLRFSQPFWHNADSDGIRIFYQNESFLITVVPADMENVLGLVSNKPGAFLFDAHERLLNREYLAFDCLANIYKQLLQGVDQCLNAAAHHFDPTIQKKLVLSASVGRATFPKYDNDKFVYIISIMRCLNAVRQFGLPISFSELNELTLSALVDRVVELRGWPIALKICHVMAIPPEQGAI